MQEELPPKYELPTQPKKVPKKKSIILKTFLDFLAFPTQPKKKSTILEVFPDFLAAPIQPKKVPKKKSLIWKLLLDFLALPVNIVVFLVSLCVVIFSFIGAHLSNIFFIGLILSLFVLLVSPAGLAVYAVVKGEQYRARCFAELPALASSWGSPNNPVAFAQFCGGFASVESKMDPILTRCMFVDKHSAEICRNISRLAQTK